MRQLCDFLATGCYAGRIPFAPGTWGSAVAVVLAGGLYLLNPSLGALREGVILATAILVVAIVVAEYAVRNALYGSGAKDPKQIVIDEIAGYFFAVAGLLTHPAAGGTAVTLLVSFLLFRLFDILKPPPARQLERLPGGYGIVMDDIAAGIMANITYRIFLLVAA